MANAVTDTARNQASGLDRDWTVREGFHCGDWTISQTERAGVGWSVNTEDGFLNGGDLECGALPLVCVEQP